MWDAIITSGSDLGLKPCGLGARDTLRLEMGYALYGNDISDTTTPLEADLLGSPSSTRVILWAGSPFIAEGSRNQ